MLIFKLGVILWILIEFQEANKAWIDFFIIAKDFLPLLSKRANLYKQYPKDAVLQRYIYLFYCLRSRRTYRGYMERHLSGLPATQARCEGYMPLIQYP